MRVAELIDILRGFEDETEVVIECLGEQWDIVDVDSALTGRVEVVVIEAE